MTIAEKKLIKALADRDRQIRDMQDGAREINRIMDAILCRIALEYGARLPDGGRVLTLEKRPTVALTDDWEVRTTKKAAGGYRIAIFQKNSGSGGREAEKPAL